MIAGSVSDRVVVVLGEGQGSGVLLGRNLVLTAQHVVGGGGRVEVIHPSSRHPVPCFVTWADESLDAAVLLADSEVIGPELSGPLGQIRVGGVGTGAPLPHCQIVGFPGIQRYGGLGDLEYDQFRATVLPLAGRMRDVLVCELDVPPADERGADVSPLAGLSGAPVFAGAVLLGVVHQVPRGRSHLRIEAVPITTVLAEARSFRWGFKAEDITDVHPRDELFEVRYAKDLAAQYRKTEIFGIEELGRTESRWDLDTAYLSLEAETAAAEDERREAGYSAQRIDSLLVERPRALLRGQAGAGKTTLVWWLAAHAANGTLSENLWKLNGLVPFVIPMREVYARGGRFPAVSELLSAGRVISDDAPDGWAGRVLEAGRGLLLVDGLDEVPPEEREKARRWLSALLTRYPDTRCLATVRPDAVEKDWLRAEGFTELTLLPMSDEDVQAFVSAWHDAARLESEHVYDARRCGDEQELLSSLEQDLAHQLEQSTALRDLARTPLLCAVICALHRRRRGLLPTTRWSLYRAALAMLLGGRDAARGVSRPDDISLDSDEQHVLLQRLAIWLVRTEQQQMTTKLATHQLELAMRDMPQVRAQASPYRVLRFLLERSGVLQERTDDAIQFIHRTFQDFLAAKEFHESGYVLELLNHAGDETWRDVIVLAVGHATRTDAQLLIEKLVMFGDVVEGREEKWYLHVLAAQCATSLLSLDAALMEVVRGRVRALMPPLSRPEAVDIAGLGAWAVELLPGPKGDDGSVGDWHIVDALARIRTAEARRKLRQFALRSRYRTKTRIVLGWVHQPAEQYAREVLAGSGIDLLEVQNSSQLAQLPHLDSLRRVLVTGSYSAEELDACLPTRDLVEIGLQLNETLTRMDFLRKREHLRVVKVIACPALGFDNDEWSELLDGWTTLEGLRFYGDEESTRKMLRAAALAPRLKRLDLVMNSLDSLTELAPLPAVREVQLCSLRDHRRMAQVSLVFPRLETLALEFAGDAVAPLDLTHLRNLHGLRQVLISGTVTSRPRIVGADAIGARLTDQLRVLGAYDTNAPQDSGETVS
ncbi:NACHT domain-containing protein [Streptomyces ferrugineus]|uniref:NACHT domain-containing protein n=1 Tax=Streptomyces ferrugineus TaxID=1413221 RepID=A0A7M2SQD9_9ACTN|nr:NACHT domain-containing protein [Streptomyces ferrugineus]QOV38570.1 NACHT domain-containing protein [Streptomyces ferrugineus]